MVPDNPAWIHFARVMAPLMAMPAQMLAELLDVGKARSMRVLDVAAGHGLFGIEVAKRNPNAQVTGLDWKTVLPVARENAAAAGIAERYHTIEGDALSGDLGGPYDLVLIPNFLHHFDVQTNTAFLRRVRGALAPGGRVAVFEFVPDENRISPPPPAAFSLIMLMMTEAGDAYPFSVYQQMFRDAGYSKVSQHPMPPGFETAVIAE
jgi:cyclopropane fatty-acyl-phospholipid synthase-like methyltransferase